MHSRNAIGGQSRVCRFYTSAAILHLEGCAAILHKGSLCGRGTLEDPSERMHLVEGMWKEASGWWKEASGQRHRVRGVWVEASGRLHQGKNI